MLPLYTPWRLDGEWRFLDAFAKLRKATASSCMSFYLFSRPHGTTRLPLDGFSWNCFEYFRKSVESVQVLLKSGKNNGYYMKTNVHFWLYLARFFLEWEILQTKVVEKIKIHISRSVTSFQKWCCVRDNVERYCRDRQATDENVVHVRCILVN